MFSQRATDGETPFDILGVSEDATDQDVHAAFRRLAKQVHPDINPHNPDAAEQFRRLKEAYEAIRTADGRRRAKASSPRRQSEGFGQGGSFWQEAWQSEWNRRRPLTHRDISVDLLITLGDAFHGGIFPLQCSASPCPRCGGSGLMRMSHLGTLYRCSACFGDGWSPGVSGEVEIEPGVECGSIIRLRGKGRPGRNGCPPGDLFVTVKIKPHQRFSRIGNDLVLNHIIPAWDAALGCVHHVIGIDGQKITFAIPSGVEHGQSFVFPEHGMPMPKGGRGSLIVNVAIKIPVADGETRSLWEQMRAISQRGGGQTTPGS